MIFCKIEKNHQNEYVNLDQYLFLIYLVNVKKLMPDNKNFQIENYC